MALSERSRHAIHEGLEPLVGNEAVEEMLDNFPDRDELVTKEFLRAELAESRALLRQELASRADLERLATKVDVEVATKVDIESLASKADLERLATKVDVEVATKVDIESLASKADLERLATKVDVEVASRADLERLATKVDVEVATKVDIESLASKADLERSIAKIEAEMATKADLEQYATKAELQILRHEITAQLEHAMRVQLRTSIATVVAIIPILALLVR